MLALQCQCCCHDGTCVWDGSRGCASWAVMLCVCENSDGWLVAWGMCECRLVRFSAVWILAFTLL